MPNDGKRLGFNAGIFFDTRPPSALIMAGMMAGFRLAFHHPRRFLAGCAAFTRLPQLHFGERKRWHAFFYALSLAGTHIFTGKVTKLFSFSAGISANIAMLAGLFSGTDYNFNVVAQDMVMQSPAELLEKLRHARFVTVQTKYDKAYLQGLGRFSTPIYVFHQGIDLERFNFPRRFRCPAPPYRLLTVNALDSRHDTLAVLTSLAMLRDRGVRFCYTIIGDGPERSNIEASAQALGLASHVCIKMPVDQEELLKEYHHSDVFIYNGNTSTDRIGDSIPNVLLESMACGLPVVASANGGIPELIENEETGMLFTAGHAEELLDACLLLLEDDITRELVIMKARLKIEEHYNLSRRIAEFVEICEENDLLA